LTRVMSTLRSSRRISSRAALMPPGEDAGDDAGDDGVMAAEVTASAKDRLPSQMLAGSRMEAAEPLVAVHLEQPRNRLHGDQSLMLGELVDDRIARGDVGRGVDEDRRHRNLAAHLE